MNDALIDKARQYVKSLFEEKYDERAAYHTFGHTKEVAEAAQRIGKESMLSEAELEAVVLAAWFHDTGYLFRMEDHESVSVETATHFLHKENYPEVGIERVTGCILATRLNHVPENNLEEVIHDADFINLSLEANLEQAELLKRETVNFGGKEPSEEEWLLAELKFLLNHKYYTEYARKKLEGKKAGNIKKIREKLRKIYEYRG